MLVTNLLTSKKQKKRKDRTEKRTFLGKGQSHFQHKSVWWLSKNSQESFPGLVNDACVICWSLPRGKTLPGLWKLSLTTSIWQSSSRLIVLAHVDVVLVLFVVVSVGGLHNPNQIGRLNSIQFRLFYFERKSSSNLIQLCHNVARLKVILSVEYFHILKRYSIFWVHHLVPSVRAKEHALAAWVITNVKAKVCQSIKKKKEKSEDWGFLSCGQDGQDPGPPWACP